MSRKRASRRWHAEHARDPFVQRARQEGYRSRAAWKLSDIDRRERLLRPGMTVVDLGAAPGGWSQVAAAAVAPDGLVVACDLLPMAPIAGVQVVQGDLADEAVWRAVQGLVGARGGAGLVLSDMAPDLSGIRAADQARSMGLAELALECAGELLHPGGALVVKVFQGSGVDRYQAGLRDRFERVRVRKPPASRGRSRELYLVATGFCG